MNYTLRIIDHEGKEVLELHQNPEKPLVIEIADATGKVEFAMPISKLAHMRPADEATNKS